VDYSDRDLRLHALALRQHGLVTRQQLVPLQYGRRAVRTRLSTGMWHEPAPGVLFLGPLTNLTAEQRIQLAVLRAGDRALVCQEAAAYLQGFVPQLEGEPEILLLHSGTRISGVGVRLSRRVELVDVTSRNGFVLTTPERTIIDLFGRLPPWEAEAILDRALQSRRTTLGKIRRRAEELRKRGRRGIPFLVECLAERDPQTARTREYWEPKVLRLIQSAGLDGVRVNHEVEVGGRKYVLDFAWPKAMVVLEFDGYATHSGRDAFEADRRRQNDLVAAGWEVLRVTAAMVKAAGVRALDPLAAVLARRP
jgi:very-short-patch-repair endonuclease